MTELLNKRAKYYENTTVKFELLNAMKDREVVFMDRKDNWKCIRGFFIRNIPTLDYLFKEYRFLDKDYNIYVSVARYNNIPMFPKELEIRSDYTKKWFLENAKKEIYDYDLFLDFDFKGDNFPKFKLEIYRICQILDYENIMFNIYPSGTGFQINISSNVIFTEERYLKIIKRFKEVFNLKYLDLKGAGKIGKIRKCEYSLVYDRVVFPIDYKNLPDFIYPEVDSNLILKTKNLFRRGLYYKNQRKIDKPFLDKYYLEKEESK